MSESFNNALARECAALHRYLAGKEPNGYALAKYQAAHDELAEKLSARDWFDTWLVRIGCAAAPAMHLVQAYARIFAPAALVRKKAVVLLAIAECSPASLDIVQRKDAQNRVALLFNTAAAIVWFALLLLAGVLLIGPLHLAARTVARSNATAPATAPLAGKGT